MKRLLILISLFVACCARGQTLSAYLALRHHYGISQAVGVEALETMVGTRVVEVAGISKGTISAVGGPANLLLQKSDGDTMMVACKGSPPDWLSGNEAHVRLIIQATRAQPTGDLDAVLLGAAPEPQIARLEERPNPVSMASRHGRRLRTVDLPANRAVPIYADFIRRRNHRLSFSESTRIATGVIGYSLRFGVDARLIMAMVMVESGFNPSATSRTGAMGLGQLMPGTAYGMGVSNAYDSIDNLYGTVRLIRGHLERYEHQTGADYQSLVLALAAYNAGAGAVAKHGGVPPYRETQNYVRKVIGIYRALCGV